MRVIEEIHYVLVNAPVRVHYRKFCTRGVSRGSIQHEAKLSAVLALETRFESNISVVHERNRCVNWLIVDVRCVTMSTKPLTSVYI